MTNLDLKAEHTRRSGELTRKRNENALFLRQMKEQEKRILECADKLGISREATLFLTELANSRRGSMKKKIEDVVSEALRLIYGPDYRVEMTYGMKNNRSNLEIEMVRTTQELGDVRREIGGFGGGMADTISVPLRLMVLLGSKQTARICVLDESWKHMDGVRIESVAEFLKTLVDKLGMQIIIATHHEFIRGMADKVYRVSETGGKSTVRAT
jgi:DNA repair exonuclease SbcCD ATPase subunit